MCNSQLQSLNGCVRCSLKLLFNCCRAQIQLKLKAVFLALCVDVCIWPPTLALASVSCPIISFLSSQSSTTVSLRVVWDHGLWTRRWNHLQFVIGKNLGIKWQTLTSWKIYIHWCLTLESQLLIQWITLKASPDHLLMGGAPNFGPLISRWEINKFENCWYKSVKILEVLKLSFHQFLNLSSSQRDTSGPILWALSNNTWSGGV